MGRSQPVIKICGITVFNETIDLEQSSGGCMHVLMVEKTGDGCISLVDGGGSGKREKK